jgi:non-canonical poly(A) RNA polymerase PAPD5/7
MLCVYSLLTRCCSRSELNEVYTGGVGSYALLVMIIAHLRTHPACGEEPNLGVLLLDFFELYGRHLRAEVVGIGAEAYLNKADRGWIDERRPDLFAVEDPREADNDLGRNSFNARAIRTAFDHAHRLLSAPAASRTESLLGRVVHLDAAFLGRPRLPGAGPIAAVAASMVTHADARRKRKREKRAAAAGQSAGDGSDDDEEDAGEDEDAAEARARKQRNRKGKRERRRQRAAEAAGAGDAEEGELEEGELEEGEAPPPQQRRNKSASEPRPGRGGGGRRAVLVRQPALGNDSADDDEPPEPGTRRVVMVSRNAQR